MSPWKIAGLNRRGGRLRGGTRWGRRMPAPTIVSLINIFVIESDCSSGGKVGETKKIESYFQYCDGIMALLK